MMKENIFIHIPKTGGTTINCVINKSEWQTTPDFNYRHIIYDTKRSNTKDIFNPLNYDKYKAYNLFMILRNPIDRMISEYYFMKDRSEFINLIKPIPKNFKSYIKNKQTQNYMIGFLAGKRMYDEDLVTQEDYDLILNTIVKLDIKVGLFEEYEKSLNFFSSITKIKIPKKIDVKRITLNRPSINDVSNDIKELIIDNNKLDFKLYNTFKEKFNQLNIDKRKVSFNHNKYNYIIKYTQRFNLLQVALKDTLFISRNKEYFDALNAYLHNKSNNNGKTYVASWNANFIKSINICFPKSNLIKKINNISIEDPLEKTIKICNILDLILTSQEKNIFNKRLIFNQNEMIIIKKTNTIKHFFSKLLP